MLRLRRNLIVTGCSLVLVMGSLALSGCGEPAPPPIDASKFEEVKTEREKIITKEYGQKAFEKGKAGEEARTPK